MTKSEIAEEAWRRAAKLLESDVLAKESELTQDDPEHSVYRHIRENVVPSLLQRSRIIGRNRKER